MTGSLSRIADEKPFGIVRGSGHHRLESRYVCEDRVETFRVLGRGPKACSDHRADDHRHLSLAAKHVTQFGTLVEDLIKAYTQEVNEHQFRDRAQSRGSRSHR